MLDFPNSPSEGDTHTDGNQAWVYLNGGWVSSGSVVSLITEIVGNDVSDPLAGHVVIGDIMIQWQAADQTDGSGFKSVTFPVAFAAGSTPSVIITAFTNTDINIVRRANNPIPADRHISFDATAFVSGGTVSGAEFFSWIAIGEAPDNLKKPTQVLGGAADDTTTRLFRVKPASSYAWSNGNNVQALITLDEQVASVGKVFATLASNKVTFTVDGWYRIKGGLRWFGPTDGFRTLGLLDLSKNDSGGTNTRAVGYNCNLAGSSFNVDEASVQAEAIVSANVGDTVEMYLTFRKEGGTGPTVGHTIAQNGTWFEIERLGDL